MSETDVLIVGAGPAGLTLACELGLAGVPALVIERDPAPPGHCRGFNLNARSLDLLDRRGLAARFLAEGPTVPTTAFTGTARLDLTAMRTGHPYVLGIPQTRVEELLAERAAELGVRVLRGHRLTALRQDDDGVDAEVDAPDGPLTLRARRLVGCDGGRSTVRRLAGIPFPGTPARRFTLLGDVVLADPDSLPFGVTGAVFAVPRPGCVRLITTDPEPPQDHREPVTPAGFQRALDRALGRHVQIAEARWLTRFGDAARLAERLVHGRVLLAGDAAHIHPPAGAVGVNAAIDDAMNLGWKLALVSRGHAPAGLLETYHTERHAAGEALLRATRAQAVLAREDEDLAPVRELLAALATEEETAGLLAETVTAVGTRYPAPGSSGHPWDGRMVPDVPLEGEGLLPLLARTGGGVLLLDGDPQPSAAAAAPWADRVVPARARPGALAGAAAVLVRPDGHAAWTAAGPACPAGPLREALARWFGPPGRETAGGARPDAGAAG
ncbi:FAD-dependent monooxygenase [Streptomyces caatingaensis]|uniref:Monooxygenase n=1 Tax=Streptomyces caatingaensis TaxID=1678637 RepID=A0A0K9XBX9_9ACTN|nr:FAD-dependent monooxygenase [Streptomyces caatingaensis]KNB50698.1 monooxygenase [Streptomyces caatingaensis]